MKIRILLLFAAIILSSSYFAVQPPQNGILDLSNLFNYANQSFPERAEYRWNEKNPLTDKGATLGRVLFYDKKLSVNNSTACASCHQQENAFGDNRKVSVGFNGQETARHAMRLVNVDFHVDNFKFWDERVSTLEKTVTLPFQNEIEMGFSGKDGFPSMDSLLTKMDHLDYYEPLFKEVYGDSEITEEKMALALAQFIRSIITFDSKFDEGFNTVGEEITNFPNFTDAENRGKRLFFNAPLGITENFPNRRIGAACGFCHKAPGFDLIHIARSNGIIGVAGDSIAIDISVRRAPSLKNLVKPDGTSNGPFMHDGSLLTLEEVVDHYNFIPADSRNTNLDGLLFPLDNGNVELRLTADEKSDIVAFLKTLAGVDLYTNEKWSDPFDESGQLSLINCAVCTTIDSTTMEQEETEIPEEVETNTGSLNLTIFNQYPWLSNLLDIDDCNGASVGVFKQGAHDFVFVSTEQETTMYYQDGTFYCQDASNYSCKEAYQLGAPSFTWECNNSIGNLSDAPFALSRSTFKKEDLSVYPNPNNGQFYISLPKFSEQQVSLSIVDATGKVVQSSILNKEQLHSPFPIQLSNINKGLYFLLLQAESGVQVEKIVIE